MKKIILLIMLALLAFNVTKAQTWAWAKSGVGGSTDEGFSVSTDLFGNVYMTGWYGSSPLTIGTYSLMNPAGWFWTFIAKYDGNGNVLWAKNSIGDPGTWDQSNSVSTDPSGNAYITGSFQGQNISFGTFTLTNAVLFNDDYFLTKYDANGNVIWAKGVVGGGNKIGSSVSTDPSGNIFVTGGFSGPTVAFGTYTLTNPGIFLSKYDSNGNVLWAKDAGGGQGNSVCTDASGNVFVTGSFNTPTITFGTYTLTNSGNDDVFLTKYNSAGNVLWAKSFGSINADNGNAVSADAAGNIYLTGVYQSPTIAFGTNTLTNSGSGDMFLVKLDDNGNVIWARTAIGSGYDAGRSVSTDASGVFVSTGFQTFTITISGTTYIAPASSTDPVYIAKYDGNGNVICVSVLASGGDDQNGVSTDQLGNVYFTSDFQPNPFVVGTTTLNTGGGLENVFLAKFSCLTTDISNFQENESVIIFPNPNNGTFVLQMDNEIENAEIILINSLGQKVHEQKISQGENVVITTELSKGLYNYIILQNKTQISTGKIAIE